MGFLMLWWSPPMSRSWFHSWWPWPWPWSSLLCPDKAREHSSPTPTALAEASCRPVAGCHLSGCTCCPSCASQTRRRQLSRRSRLRMQVRMPACSLMGSPGLGMSAGRRAHSQMPVHVWLPQTVPPRLAGTAWLGLLLTWWCVAQPSSCSWCLRRLLPSLPEHHQPALLHLACSYA